MAFSNAIWAIDVGQCALKALKCTLDDDGRTMHAEAFDFIEYPKLLSQPDAEPSELIRDALEQFLSRNDVRRDRVAISVSGQSGLARFFKPPPVDAKMIPDIVKYEARQQIPFPLEDVIWDFQQLGGTEVDGFTLDAEIGLFAIRREQAYRAIKPFVDAGIEMFFVQLSPLAVHNYVVNDILGGVPDSDEVDPDNPPESVIIVSIGTETTDLIITNGIKIWQRSVPLGGNHFTKQLSRELKLTFAKAEHLKRNARDAEDAKAVFQAMRPVFNDFVTEIQRSISFFQTLDRKTKIGRMVVLGNTVKLPGLRQYLAKNLGHEVITVDEFNLLEGTDVTGAPQFRENFAAFPVCYGLCLQGLDASALKTNLIPREFVDARLIREKKPWAIATVGTLLLACALNFFFHFSSWYKVHEEYYRIGDKSWKDAMSQVTNVASTVSTYDSRDSELMTKKAHVEGMGREVVGSSDRKLLWIELYKAIDEVLPRDPRIESGAIPDPRVIPYLDRENLVIEHIESQFFPELASWFTPALKDKWEEESLRDVAEPLLDEGEDGAAEDSGSDDSGESAHDEADGEDAADAVDAAPAEEPVADPANVAGDDPTADDPMAEEPMAEEPVEDEGPSGPGWVIEIKGYHYHNSSSQVDKGWGATYVRNTLIRNLKEGKVKLPTSAVDGAGGKMAEFTMEELGIEYPLLVKTKPIEHKHRIRNQLWVSPIAEGAEGGAIGGSSTSRPQITAEELEAARNDPKNPEYFPAPRYDFVVQFVWKERPLAERVEAQLAALRELTAAQRAEEEARRLEEGALPIDQPEVDGGTE